MTRFLIILACLCNLFHLGLGCAWHHDCHSCPNDGQGIEQRVAQESACGHSHERPSSPVPPQSSDEGWTTNGIAVNPTCGDTDCNWLPVTVVKWASDLELAWGAGALAPARQPSLANSNWRWRSRGGGPPGGLCAHGWLGTCLGIWQI